MQTFIVTEIIIGSINRKITAETEEEAIEKYNQIDIDDEEILESLSFDEITAVPENE